MILTALLFTLIPPQDARQDDPPVARYTLADGRGAAVLRSDLALELGLRLRHTQEGKEALEGLVDLRVIAAAAKLAGIEPTAEEIAAKMAQIDEGLRANDDSLDAYLTRLEMDRSAFERRFVRAGIVQERLVMKGLGTTDPREVSPELIQLWLLQARTRHRATTDEAELPDSVVGMVEGQPIPVSALGETLFSVVSPPTRAKYIRRIVLRDLVRREAERLGVEVTETDVRIEVARRRVRIEADPRYRGVSYDDWLLQTQGMTIEEFSRSPQLIATVQQRMITEKLHPEESLRDELARHRSDVLRRHGEKRELSAILMRATDEPNDLVKRTPAQAREDLLALADLTLRGRPFAELARIHSDDPRSKVAGGVLGEFPRETKDLPEAVLAAAFALPLFGVSEPVPIEGGLAILRVDAIVPPPGDAELLARLRDEFAERWLADALDAAKIESAK